MTMENDIPSLFNIDTDFVVKNVDKISKNFSEPLDLPSNLIELIFKKYLLHNRYIAEQEVKYFLSQKAHFSSIDFSSRIHVNNSWIALLPSTITSLDVSNCTRLTDEGLLKIVATLPNLKLLKINDCIHISQKCWTCVAALTHLQVFEASSTQFGDEALKVLTESCLDIRVLSLNNTRVFKAISDIKNLTHLFNLDLHSTKVTPGAVADICKALTQLKRFRAEMFDNAAFNNVFPYLPESLEALELDGLPEFYSPNFEHLTALQRLEMACWNSGNVLSINNFKHLTQIKVDADLRAEDYDWSKVKYLKVPSCDPLPHVTSLVNCNKVAFGSLFNHQLMEDLTNLTNLTCIDIEAGDDIISILKRLTNLKKISLADENQQRLSEIIPMLTDMNIKTLVAPFPIPNVTALTSLEKLGMYEQPVDLVYGVLTNLTWLETVGSSMDQISLLTNLKSLDIRYALDNRVELLTSLTNLTFLDIGGVQFTEESFEALTFHLTNLKWLLAMDVADINLLIPHMTRLHTLQHLFFDQPPAPVMLSLLAQLPSLKELHCSFALVPELNNVISELIHSPSLCAIHSEIGDDALRQQFKEVGISFMT